MPYCNTYLSVTSRAKNISIRKLLFLDFFLYVCSVCISSSLVCLSGTSDPLSLLFPFYPQIAYPVFLLGSQRCQPPSHAG